MSEQRITVERLLTYADLLIGNTCGCSRDHAAENGLDRLRQLIEQFASQQRADAVRELQRENARAMSEASSLAMSIWRQHYQKESPNFELCDSVAGVVSQIDNMVCGLYAELAAVKAQLNEAEKWRREVEQTHAAIKRKKKKPLEFCQKVILASRYIDNGDPLKDVLSPAEIHEAIGVLADIFVVTGVKMPNKY